MLSTEPQVIADYADTGKIRYVYYPILDFAPTQKTYETAEYAGEKNYVRMKSAVMEIVQQHFRPEFINRIDDIVVFHPLGTEQIRSIVDIQLGLLRRRLTERNMDLVLDDGARDLIGESGFDPVYGARPLKRAIQQQIENPLAQQLLQGAMVPGDRIRVGVADGKLTFTKAAA